MSVMFTKDLIAQLHHFHADNLQPTTFKAADNLSNQIALNATGFKQNKCCFHNCVHCEFINGLRRAQNQATKVGKKTEIPTCCRSFSVFQVIISTLPKTFAAVEKANEEAECQKSTK